MRVETNPQAIRRGRASFLAAEWNDPFALKEHFAWTKLKTAQWYVGVFAERQRSVYESLDEEPVRVPS